MPFCVLSKIEKFIFLGTPEKQNPLFVNIHGVSRRRNKSKTYLYVIFNVCTTLRVLSMNENIYFDSYVHFKSRSPRW